MDSPQLKKLNAGHSNFLPWMLILTAAAMLVLHLCKNQGKIKFMDEKDFFLKNSGKVILFSRESKKWQTKADGVEIIDWNKFEGVGEILKEKESKNFKEWLEKRKINTFITGPDFIKDNEIQPDSVIHRLATFKFVSGFNPLLIEPYGAIYTFQEFPEVSLTELQKLIKTARKEFVKNAATELIFEKDSKKSLNAREPVFEVALGLQGLEPVPVNKPGINYMRKEIYSSGKGKTIKYATITAARNLRKEFTKKYSSNLKDIEKVAQRSNFEIQILYDFSLVNNYQPDLDSTAYKKFLDAVFQPGIWGAYINRTILQEGKYLSPPRSKMRLPSDAVYWMRLSGSSVVERVAKDSGIENLMELKENRKITLDRFRSIHAIEIEPQGKVVLCGHALPVVTMDEVSNENIDNWGEKAFMWLSRFPGSSDKFFLSYLPDRDFEKTESSNEPSFLAFRHILKAQALLEGEKWQRGKNKNYPEENFEQFLKKLIKWVRLCQIPGSKKPAIDVPPGIEMEENCFSIISGEKPVSTGKPIKNINKPVAYIFAGKKSASRDSALLGYVITRYIEEGTEHERKERQKQFLPLLSWLTEFLLFMQKEDGSFRGYLTQKGSNLYNVEDLTGGFISINFLIEVSRILKDKRIENALKNGLTYYKDALIKVFNESKEINISSEKSGKDLIEAFGWGLWAIANAARHYENEEDAKMVIDLATRFVSSFQIMDSQWVIPNPEIGGGIVLKYDENPDFRSIIVANGLIECAKLAKKWQLTEFEDVLIKSINHLMRFSSQLQLRTPGSLLFVPGGEKADGGIRISLLNSTQRIDTTSYFIIACRKYLQVGNKE